MCGSERQHKDGSIGYILTITTHAEALLKHFLSLPLFPILSALCSLHESSLSLISMINARILSNKANRRKSRAPRKQRPMDGPTDGPTERLIELRARD